VLTFLLLLAASFALFSRAAEYSMMSREMSRAAEFYRGVAVIELETPDMSDISPHTNYLSLERSGIPPERFSQPYLTLGQISVFEELDQVTSVDRRYMTAGISLDGFERMEFGDEELYVQANRFIIEAEYHVHPHPEFARDGVSYINFRRINLLAGNQNVIVGDSMRINTLSEDGIDWREFYGERGVVQRLIFEIYDNPFGREFFESLVEGERYLLVGRWEPRSPFFHNWLGDFATMDYWPSIMSVEGLPENYLELDEFAPIRTLIEMTEQDRYTFDMVYTSDMLSISRFANQQMIIHEGRPLTPADAYTTNAVVSRSFFERYNVSIGDTINFGLGDILFEQNPMVGATAGIPERFAPPIETVELAIVGVWTDTETFSEQMRSVFSSYSRNTIFVPSTLLSVDVPRDHQYFSGEVSFIIDNPHDIYEFTNAAKAISEFYEIYFRVFDAGWERMAESLNAALNMALITMTLFAISSAAALLLSVWLFIGRSMKAYAIMRALGVEQHKTRMSILIPFGALAITAIPIGMVLGLVFTAHAIAPTLEDIAETIAGYEINATLPVFTIVVILLSIIAFLIIFTAMYFHRMRKTPPLALLQSDTKRRVRTKKQVLLPDSVPISDVFIPVTYSDITFSLDVPKGRKYFSFFHIVNTAIRRIRRTWWKATLSLLLTVLFCGAIGVLIFTRQTYEDMFNNFEVRGFITYAASDAIHDAIRSELVDDVFYRDGTIFIRDEASFDFAVRNRLGLEMVANFSENTRMIVTNDVERYLLNNGISDFEIIYVDGFEPPLISFDLGDFNRPIVVGSELAQILGFSLGDDIRMSSPIDVERLYTRVNDFVDMSGARDFLSDVVDDFHFRELLEVGGFIGDEITRFMQSYSSGFNVVGILECIEHGMDVFAPIGQAASSAFRQELPTNVTIFTLEYFEFRVADMERLDEAVEFAHRMRASSTRMTADARLSLNTIELDNMTDILELIDILFPFALAGAVLIGILTPTLLLIQSTKDAAVMRAMGTTRRRTCSIFGFEQILLCILGLLIVTATLVIYDFSLVSKTIQPLLLCFGMYLSGYVLATVVTVVIVTRHKVLELLQMKE